MRNKPQECHNIVLRSKLITSIICVAVLLASNTSSLPEPAVAAEAESENITQTELPPKGNPKLDTALNNLATETTSRAVPSVLESGATPAEGIRVIVEGTPGQAEEIARAVGDLGTVEANYSDWVQMVVPTSQLTVLADMPEIRFVRLPSKPLPSITSEGVPVINADGWLASSYNGTGVKIGILDVGFSGYINRQSEGELSDNTTTWWAPSIGDEGTSVHGTACAEIVYDIAPEAGYYFANFATEVEYGNAVEWLVDQNVDVISCSVSWPTGGPGDGTGTFCQIVDFAKAAGILWVQSVGNQAERHWQGDFTNTDADVFHDFATGDEGNTFSVQSGQIIVAALKWDDTWGASANDYDLLLFNSSGQLVAYSASVQDGDDDPWEALSYTAMYDGTYSLAIATFDPPEELNFAEHIIDYGFNNCISVYAADIDGDGDVDLLSHSSADTLGIAWWENDGNENFVRHIIDSNFHPRYDNCNSIYAADIDLDGDIDILGAAGTENDIAYWENDGNENFTKHTIDGNYLRAASVYAADVDSDGDVDVLGAAEYLSDISWWENDGNENFTKHTVTDDYTGARSVYAIDIDGDGDIDILGAAVSDPMAWWENDGNENFTKHTIIMNYPYSSVCVYAADIDGDSDIDLISTRGGYSGQIIWWENDGNESFTGHFIVSGNLDYPWDVYATDLDGDGDVDVLATALTYGEFAWWENDGNGNFINRHNITSGFGMYNSVYATDIDGDGDVDVLGSARGPDNSKPDIKWWESNLDTFGHVNFHLYSYYHDLQYQTASGSLIVPADSFSALAVGAVDYATPTALESFSSRGPTDDGRVKPDLVAPDGVSTVSYGTANFSGTSASAPNAAGAAALVKERFPSYNATQIQSFLEGRAADLGSVGKDNLYGSGGLQLGDSANSYTLTMAVSGSGNVTPAVGNHTYAVGSTVNITATPESGWQFTEWAGDVTNVGLSSTNITMDSDKKVTANFNLTTANLTMMIYGSGDITPSLGSHGYPLNSTVNLTATPSSNWEFINWNGDVSDNTSANTAVIMDTNKTVTANFNRVNSVLRTEVSGSGNVTPTAGSHTYPVGATVNITATPATNWEFVNWEGDVTDNTSASTNITMNWDKTITANFNRVAGTLTMAVSGSGDVTPAVGNHTYPVGATVNITATPASGWRFVNWAGDVDTVADVNSARTNVTMNSDYSITANFSDQATLTMAVSGSGSVTPATGNHTYAVGSTVNITATPASGWQFSSWTGDVANANSATTNVTMNTDKNVIANFSQIPPPPPPSGGGGGGGGGGIAPGTTIISDMRNSRGDFIYEVTAKSMDDKCLLKIDAGTKGLTNIGRALSKVTIVKTEAPPDSPSNFNTIGAVYDLGPDGATFDPPIDLNIKYVESELPEGVAEANLIIARFDESTSQLVELESEVNAENDTISTKIDHLSLYTIMAGTRPAEFTIANLSINPSMINTGGSATVRVTVTNVGDLYREL
ncbi:FG-GAP-like repeat-containing protein [Chloroflexota bacterium]